MPTVARIKAVMQRNNFRKEFCCKFNYKRNIHNSQPYLYDYSALKLNFSVFPIIINIFIVFERFHKFKNRVMEKRLC